MFGALSGSAVSLVNIPTVFATAVCIGLVPVISAARVERRADDMRKTSQLGLRLGSLIGFPCAVGMSLLATPIIRLLVSSFSAEDIALSGKILSISALSIFFFTQVQATTGILQGAGLHKIPMYSLAVGVVCKIALNFILIGIPSVNIYGAPVASIVCYGVSMIINLLWISRRMGIRTDWGGVLLRPLGATAGLAVAVLLATHVLDMGRRLNTLVAIAIGAAVYVALLFALRALTPEDMAQIPGGQRLERLLRKLRVWR
jgi:stage V sporulation protein B